MHERNLEDHERNLEDLYHPDISIFRYLHCGWRVGGKYWFFYNPTSSSVWTLFAAEKGKKQSDVSGK